mgnify:CR=1 FL=1
MSTTPAVTGPTAGKDTNSGLNFRHYLLYSWEACPILSVTIEMGPDFLDIQ